MKRKPPFQLPALVLWLLAFPSFGQTPTATPSVVVIGNLGDFGDDNQPELDVSNLIKSWNPDLITTNGDNNYDLGELSTIDDNIGKYYHEYIGDYQGSYGPGAPFNRFFLVLGNHDWDSGASPLGCQPYLDWFTHPSGPGNERYYEFGWGPVRFFMLDSDPREPDGIDVSSVQAAWLQARLAVATECWRIVQLHHAPYSSCSSHGSHPGLQWPFEAWGASAVIAGHDHVYERLQVGGIPYFVNGTGGRPLNAFNPPLPESRRRYNADYGAMRITATGSSLTFEYFNRATTPVDTPWVLTCPFTASPTETSTSTLTMTATPTDSPTETATSTASMTATPTDSPTETATSTASGTTTPTDSPTETATSTASMTATPTNSPTETSTSTLTVTSTPTDTPVPPTPTDSSTPLPPTATLSPTPGTGWGFHPVPVLADGPVTLRLPSGASANVGIRIYTIGGERRVLHRSLPTVPPDGEVPIDLRDDRGELLANGLYRVLVTAGGKRWLRKFVIFR